MNFVKPIHNTKRITQIKNLLRGQNRRRNRQKHKTVSQWLRAVIDQTLAIRNRARVKQMYEVLEELDEVGKRGITDASTTIDELLYLDNVT